MVPELLQDRPMRRSFLLVSTGFAIVLIASCGTITEQPDAAGQGGTTGQAGSGASGSAGTTGQAGNGGTTGQGGAPTGQAGAGPGGGGGATGSAGRGGTGGAAGTTGNAGATGSAGRGGTGGGAGATGNAGTTGSAGRGGTGGGAGTTGGAGATGSAGRGGAGGSAGATGSAGRGGQGGQTDAGLGCSELEAEYSKAVQEARACNPDGTAQCQQLVDTGLACPGCQVRVTDTRGPDAIRAQWNRSGCTPPIFCPAVICVAPGPGMCTRSDASGSGGICTMQSGGIGPL
jgi:hypothetical protein